MKWSIVIATFNFLFEKQIKCCFLYYDACLNVWIKENVIEAVVFGHKSANHVDDPRTFYIFKNAIKKKLKFHLGYKRWKWREWTKLNVDFSEEKEEEEFKLDGGSPFQMQTIILFCCFRRSAFLLELDISMDLLDDENNEAILNWWETHKLYTKNALQFISCKKNIC